MLLLPASTPRFVSEPYTITSGPVIALPATATPIAGLLPAQAASLQVTASPFFAYDNKQLLDIAASDRNHALVATEQLLDHVVAYLSGKIDTGSLMEYNAQYYKRILQIGKGRFLVEKPASAPQVALPPSRPYEPRSNPLRQAQTEAMAGRVISERSRQAAKAEQLKAMLCNWLGITAEPVSGSFTKGEWTYKLASLGFNSPEGLVIEVRVPSQTSRQGRRIASSVLFNPESARTAATQLGNTYEESVADFEARTGRGSRRIN